MCQLAGGGGGGEFVLITQLTCLMEMAWLIPFSWKLVFGFPWIFNGNLDINHEI